MPANRPYVIGLTGGIACGKSEAAAYLASLGAAQFDADAASHALTAEGGAALEGIRAGFGDGVFFEDGTLDRAALAKIVFSSPAHRRALEGVIHPLVQRDACRAMDDAVKNGVRIVVLNVPLLFETGMDALCDETWVLRVDREMQISRLATRNGYTREQAEARIDSQMSDADRVVRATHVIDTDRPIEQTRRALAALYKQAEKAAR